ncbi:MAG: 4Fe-4S binding protein [Candidatus Auribacterota bacterium]
MSVFQVLYAPLTSPFLLLGLLLVLERAYGKEWSARKTLGYLLAFTACFWSLYSLSIQVPQLSKWLYRMQSDIIPALTLLVLPILFLPQVKRKFLFIMIPVSAILIAVFDVMHRYRVAPSDSGFHWIPVNPPLLIMAVASIIILAARFLSPDALRKFCRIACLLVLLFGGFMFRKNYADYQDMLARRQDTQAGIMNIMETVPVMRDDNRLTYLPSAPCRFSADGGYVQGCVMELSQRFMQLRFDLIGKKDPAEISLLAIILGAFAVTVVLLFIVGRWWCGWVCPLATIGDALDFVRRKLGISHFKPSATMKMTAVWSGIFTGTIGLLLARAYALIDENGEFMGCKIPLYPFCKICPGQQVCPVASQGIGAFPALPGMEWLFGFFRVGVVVLLLFFVLAFMSSRRLWCRFCPMGIFGGLFNKGGMILLRKEPLKCNGCGACNEVCPMDIHYVEQEMSANDVTTFDCIYCMKCVSACPQDKCLSLEFAGKTILQSDLQRKLHG